MRYKMIDSESKRRRKSAMGLMLGCEPAEVAAVSAGLLFHAASRLQEGSSGQAEALRLCSLADELAEALGSMTKQSQTTYPHHD